MPMVRTGLDLLRDSDFAPLRGRRVGLVSHAAAIDSQYRTAFDLFRQNLDLKILFSPEHGYFGTAQDLIPVADDRNGDFAIRSLYGENFESLKPKPTDLSTLDCLVIDMVDIGSRYYTFQATMLYCLEAADEIGLPVMVLDRPNPIGGLHVEGPTVRPGYESFVGCHPIATRHGLTMGELAKLYHAELKLSHPLEIVPCEGWERRMTFEETGLPWVLPSPNMPTPATALVYPGQCLLEGTNLSEGRGTTRPFEICGAPWLDESRLANEMNRAHLAGVHFRPVRFRPTFQKFAGQECGGVQLHVTDPVAFRPLRTSVVILGTMRRQSGDRFHWRTERYEFVDHLPAVDILFGSGWERERYHTGATAGQTTVYWQLDEDAFRERREPFLLYR